MTDIHKTKQVNNTRQLVILRKTKSCRRVEKQSHLRYSVFTILLRKQNTDLIEINITILGK